MRKTVIKSIKVLSFILNVLTHAVLAIKYILT